MGLSGDLRTAGPISCPAVLLFGPDRPMDFYGVRPCLGGTLMVFDRTTVSLELSVRIPETGLMQQIPRYKEVLCQAKS